MAYKILNRTETTQVVEYKTVVITVEYDIDGTLVVTDIAHFQPSNEEDIILGIENREVTERERLNGE